MASTELNLSELTLGLSCTDLLRDNSCNSCSSESHSPVLKSSPKKKLTTQKTMRWKDAKHKLDTIDDYTLTEEIKDLLDKYDEKDKIQMHELEQQIFTELKCNNSYKYGHLQNRIVDIIYDIYHQQGIEIETDPLSPSFDSKESDDQFSNFPGSQLNIFDNKDIESVARFKYDQQLVELNEELINKIKNEFKTKMNKLLSKNSSRKLLKQQCRNDKCNDINEAKSDDILDKCPSLQRICVLLDIYYQFNDELNTKNTLDIVNCFQMNNQYDGNRLHEDFLHIHKIHMHENHQMQKLICGAINDKYPCNAIKKKNKCWINDRHQHFMDKNKNNQKSIAKFSSMDSTNTPDRNTTNGSDENVLYIPPKLKYVKSELKDIVMIQQCEKIHCYFLHSLVNNTDDDDEMEEKMDEENIFEFYGEKEDKQWINSIMDDKYKIEYEQQIYEKLLSNMGVFRWQGAHGFNNRQSHDQDLTHIKPRYKNVKEEVLKNKYWQLTISNWNTTVAKVMQFNKSFASEKMRTERSSKYHDQIFHHKAEWKRGETPSIKEITVIKLYTDWDELQSELKKCFRLESVDDIVSNYSTPARPKLKLMNRSSEPLSPRNTADRLRLQLSVLRNTLSAVKLKKSITPQLSMDKAASQLKQRLSEFFHWRGSLLIFINKFSEIILPTTRINNNNVQHKLYHGVNRRMLLNPSSTQSFYGPLSTTSSYYVAQTFATDKGMILEVSSKYPRLGMCNAFDASPISDYPEEEEFLIGHIYLRIRKVYTKVFEHIPIDSRLRYAFFALHLFREQMFSMNPILETYIIPFIQIHLTDVMECKDKWLIQLMKKDENENNNRDFKYLKQILKWRKDEFRTQTPRFNNDKKRIKKKNNETPNEVIKKSRIFYILIKKFNEFVTEPNLKQILRLDCISTGLRPYFLKKSEHKLKKKKNKNINVEQDLYVVSFKKLITLFPNTEQIHFFNWYKFDNNALKKLIAQIKRKNNRLKAVKFLYYDYNNPLEKHQFFFDDNKLDTKLKKNLTSLNWIITGRLDKTGYSIKLKQI